MALIQANWGPYEERELTHTLGDGHGRAQGEGGLHLQAEEGGLGRNQLWNTFALGLLTSRTVGKYTSVVSTTCCAALCHGNAYIPSLLSGNLRVRKLEELQLLVVQNPSPQPIQA